MEAIINFVSELVKSKINDFTAIKLKVINITPMPTADPYNEALLMVQLEPENDEDLIDHDLVLVDTKALAIGIDTAQEYKDTLITIEQYIALGSTIYLPITLVS